MCFTSPLNEALFVLHLDSLDLIANNLWNSPGTVCFVSGVSFTHLLH